MYTSVFILVLYSVLTCAITILNYQNDIISKIRIQAEPLNIRCSLTDIVIISAPMIGGKKAHYRLYNPAGEFRKLDIFSPNYTENDAQFDNYINAKVINESWVITSSDNYDVFNVNFGASLLSPDENDVFDRKLKRMKANDFMIGPLDEDDCGNWVLSIFYKNENNEWVEVYQVITIDIKQFIPSNKLAPLLKLGDTFQISFAYPIKNLETCELIVPSTTFDRFYNRENSISPNVCGYVLKNVTWDDAGIWKIIGVGKITYEAVSYLNISDEGKIKKYSEEDYTLKK